MIVPTSFLESFQAVTQREGTEVNLEESWCEGEGDKN